MCARGVVARVTGGGGCMGISWEVPCGESGLINKISATALQVLGVEGGGSAVSSAAHGAN